VFRAQEDLSYLFADDRIAGVAKAAGRHPLHPEPLYQEFGLGGLTDPIRPIENNKFTCKFVFPVLVTHFWFPILILSAFSQCNPAQ
jgi:hypothetical protein